jgi:hypothetical protein
MAATFEVTIGLLGLGERGHPINYRAQAVHLDSTVHGFEIDAADAARAPASGHPTARAGRDAHRKEALIDSSSSFGAFGAAAEGVC